MTSETAHILQWENIVVKSRDKSKKIILSNVSGSAKSGEMLTIMGSSGAGKSTLLNVLAKRNLKRIEVDGVIKFDGAHFEDKQCVHHAGYIQQSDYFMSSLTVREHLRFQAKMVLGQFDESLIEEKLQQMGLQNCADNLIGDPHSSQRISGGESKRLAIATEMLSDPMIIFADEPTSGLDAYMADAVTKILKKLAENGAIVITTIHQPSVDIFNRMDSIFLLSLGKVIYNGSNSELQNYLISIGKPILGGNMADHIINITSYSDFSSDDFNVNLQFHQNKIETMHRQFIDSDAYAATQQDIRETTKQCALTANVVMEGKTHASKFLVFLTLLHRTTLDQFRDKEFKAKCIQHLVTALVVGAIFMRTPWSEKINPYLTKVRF